MKKRIILILCIALFGAYQVSHPVLSREEILEQEGRLEEVLMSELQDIKREKSALGGRLRKYQSDLKGYAEAKVTRNTALEQDELQKLIKDVSKEISREKRKVSQLKRKEARVVSKLQAFAIREKARSEERERLRKEKTERLRRQEEEKARIQQEEKNLKDAGPFEE